MDGSNAHMVAAASILVMVAVTVFMDWVPTRLNRNLRGMTVRERLPSTVIHSTLGLVFSAANIALLRWGMLLGAVWYTVVLIAAMRNWWLPYFFGVHVGEITPEIYRRRYEQNVRVLPRVKKNPVVPDVQHMLIHLTVLFAAAWSWLAFWQA